MKSEPPEPVPGASAHSVFGSTGLNAPGATFHAPVNLNVEACLLRPLPSRQELLALGSVEAPYGRLPEAVLGRDALLRSLRHVDRTDPPRIQVLTGMGGVGKTTVALSAAHRAKDSGVEIFWIQAGSATAVADGMRHAALLAGAPADYVAHAWERGGRPAADLAWRYLEKLDRPWLLVLDDADDLDTLSCPDAALADATGWVRPPVGSSQGVLVTTRDGNAASWGNRIAHVHRLDVLERDFAGQILHELAPLAGDTADACALADRLGSLPLALHLAGTYLGMAHGDPLAAAQTFAEYLDLLGEFPILLDDAIEDVRGDLRNEEEHARRTIAGTWELSLSLLERQGAVHVRKLLQLLSCFAPTSYLPKALLDASAIAPLGVWPASLPTRSVKTALTGLRRFGLIGVNTRSGESACQIHRLVAEISVAPLITSPRDYQDVWNAATDLLVSATPYMENPRDPTCWPIWQGLAPHWLTLMSRLPRWGSVADDRLSAALICAGVGVAYLTIQGDYNTACRLAENAFERADSTNANPWIGVNIRKQRAIAVKEMGDLAAAEEELDHLADECTRKLGADHSTTLAVRYERAGVSTRRGRLTEAEREYDEVIRHETRLYGSEAANTLRSRHARAICIRGMGRLDEAAAESRQVLEGLRAELGERHPDVLEAQHEFAVSLRDQGANEKADAAFRQVLELEQDVLGADHPSTLITRANLATTLILREQFSAAETEIRSVLEARTRILGPEHPETLDARHTLAILLMSRGELDARSAATVFAELTNAQKRQFLDDHPNVLAGRSSQAATMRALGNLAESESEYKAILTAVATRHGDHHAATLNARYEWAMALGRIGRTDDAISEMREVLAQQERVLGIPHRNVSSVRASLGVLLLQQGCLAEAEDQLRHALEALPADDGARQRAQHDLAAVLNARGRRQEAITLLQEIVESEEQRLGAAHPDTITTRNNLGLALKSLGLIDEAEAVYREALSTAAPKHSDDQPLILALRHNLAVVLRIRGHLDEAEKEQSAILAIQERTLGLEHPETLSTRAALARILDDRGTIGMAETAYREIRSVCARVLGAAHPQTLSVQGNLAFLLADQERFAEAESEYRDAVGKCEDVLGQDHPETLTMNHNLAMALGNQGMLAEAIPRFREVLKRRERVLGPDHSETLIARRNLGEGLCRAGQRAASAEQFKALSEGLARTHGLDHNSAWDAHYRCAQLLWEAGQPRAAQRELEILLDRTLESRAAGDPRISAIERVLLALRADDGAS